MNSTLLFGLLGGLLLLGFVANRLFQRTRVPDLIVLMVAGILIGPVLHWVDAQWFRPFTDALGTLALILILFEAGSELDLRHTIKHFPTGLLLGLLGYGLSFGAIVAVGMFLMKMELHPALLLGSVLACTSSTMVFPMLQQLSVPEPVKVTLLLEATLGDVLATLTVGSFLGVSGGDLVFGKIMGVMGVRIGISAVAGIVGGVLWSRLWIPVAARRFANVATFATVLLVYAGARAIGGSGLLASLIFGLTIANMPGPNRAELESPRGRTLGMMAFHSELSFLVRSFFFVLLGATVRFIGVDYVLPTVCIIAAILIVRMGAVWLATLPMRRLKQRERSTIFWIFPRGLINAVLAIQVVSARGGEFGFLPDMAFTLIVATNLLGLVSAVKSGRVSRAEVAVSAAPEPPTRLAS